MPITDQYARVLCANVIIPEDRQRKNLDTSDIDDSIATHGVLQPIILRSDLTLVAGERRLRSSIKAGFPDVPCRFLEDLSPQEAAIIELEENLKRKDLHWREEVTAIAKIHGIYSEADVNWTLARTAAQLCISETWIGKAVRVANDIENPRIANATSAEQAYNTLKRLDERRFADKLSDVLEAGVNLFKPKAAAAAAPAAPAALAVPTSVESSDGQQPPRATVSVTSAPVPASMASNAPQLQDGVLNTSFADWLSNYSGPPFNFLHCDFPYGVNVFGGPWSGKNSWETYSDKEADYFTLIQLLCSNLDRVLAPSSHLMFWFSMEYYVETLEMFRELAPSLEFSPFPLIWWKTDNAGIAPRPHHEPRRVYETALFASRSERPVVKTVSNVYGCPTDKKWHPSTKPEQMLRHFFTMFCDETTRMLDPTCGGGSALRAAESLAAQQVLGLEMSEEYATNASVALRQFRAKRNA